jgi:hypothetical protein
LGELGLFIQLLPSQKNFSIIITKTGRLRQTCIAQRLAKLLASKIVNDRCDSTLSIIGVVQVDQRSAGAGMVHACHQFAQARPRRRSQEVAGMAKVVEVDLRQARVRERWQPGATSEVAAP